MTQPHNASQELDFNANAIGPFLLAPVTIFDHARVMEAIERSLANVSDPLEARCDVLAILRETREEGVKRIELAFKKEPRSAQGVINAYAFLTDGIMQTLWRFAHDYLNPNPTPTQAERIAVLAVGGYGRAEMAPYSDVDLLFVIPYKATPWTESLIESMLYMLWDLKLKLGHSVRSIEEAVRLGSEDFTIRTAMLEQRFVCGDHELAKHLKETLRSSLFTGTEREFIEAKLEERDARHEKQGAQRFMVEPNVKEGKGGLRDLQSLFWIAKYAYDTDRPKDLIKSGVFRTEEYEIFERAWTFLWAVRCHLHLLTGRISDQLSFDLQVSVAQAMGYRDNHGRRGVEYFMQDYFRHATAVGDLTRIFLTDLEARHTKAPPFLQRLFKRKPAVKPGYIVLNNRLSIQDPLKFIQEPLNLLQLFAEALRTGLLIHPDAMRLVKSNLNLIDDKLRSSPEGTAIFIALLLDHGNPERALRRMNELGVLSAFLPEFVPIVAMMQYNMYHSYTVDEHIIQCISQLAMIERRELTEELPVASAALAEGINRRVLYVALLLHDIGKGRDEDHSILGAKIARKVAPRLGLSKAETAKVEWLVRYHLLMSDLAQKRDITDPRTIRDFAKAVQTVERLNLLTVLTVCDIRGVGPTIWNNWKATLLRTLYAQTREALENGMEQVTRENRGSVAKRALRDRLHDWSPTKVKRETKRHYPPYWQGLHVTAHEVFARMLDGIEEDDLRIDLHPDEDRDATRVCTVLANHPGIFARLTGALAIIEANIVDARSFTSKDGFATTVFWIQDSDGHPFEARRFARLKDTIRRSFLGEIVTSNALMFKDKIKKRERAFRVPTSITFDNDGSDIYTIIEVDTRDRPGLLFDLSKTLSAANLYIASAIIATYGAQAVDSFYVKDLFGLKLYSQSKQRQLEKKLRVAILSGVARAQA